MTRYLSVAQVIETHRGVMADHGQSSELAVVAKLESAVHRPEATAFGEDAYPTLSLNKAAALLHGLVAAHAFVDGNKRVGLAATILFLKRNGSAALANQEDLHELVLAIASGELRDIEPIAERLRALFGLPD